MESTVNYPWEFAPPGFEWAAIDKNNNAYWYREEPKMGNSQWATSNYYDDEMGPCFITIGVYNAPAGFDWKKSLQKKPGINIENKDVIEMVPVEGGTFLMGGKLNVTLSDFEIGKYPVTQKQWRKIIGTNPSHFSGDDLPVENVSWNDAQEFIKQLNVIDPGKNYRLPTEAEWEYAARGGRLSKGYEYAGSNDLNKVGWYCNNSDRKTHSVGQLKPNELGIHDMSGNVCEWCEDWCEHYPDEAEENYSGPQTGIYCVLRGGSWYLNDYNCRSANRVWDYPDLRVNFFGFRVSRHL